VTHRTGLLFHRDGAKRIRCRACICAAVPALILMTALLPVSGFAQATSPDTRAHSPRAALWRSAVLPGWGQVYNRQYYKLPIIYGGLGFLTVTAVNLHHDYILYRQAFQYKAFQELVDSGQLETNPKAEFEDAYNRIAAEFGPISSSPLRSRRDALRRNRDLTFIGIGIVYGLQMLDAFVSAHLFDFDIDENLSMNLRPSPAGLRASLRLSF
jgi:hypothetical protein